MMNINRILKYVLACACFLGLVGCGAEKIFQPAFSPTPAATTTRTSTITQTFTLTNTFTPTYTATATPVPIKDRDLSAIILQLSELPDGYLDLQGWSGPGCMSEIYKDYAEVHENLVHGYSRDFASEDGYTIIGSSLFVYGDVNSAQKSYQKITGELKGKNIDMPAMGSESIANLYMEPTYEIYFLDVVWRDDQTVLDLIYLGKQDPVTKDIIEMAKGIQERMDSPVSIKMTPPAPVGGRSGQIAFKNNGAVYIVDAEGGGLTCILHNLPVVFSYSPDGKKIVFGPEMNAKGRIQIIHSDGSALSDLLEENGGNPQWSPDGTRIAYFSADNGYLYTIEPDGKNKKQLTDYSADFQWYQGGKKIGLVRSFSSSNWVISMNSDGGESAVVAKLLSFPYETCCVWSPDGESILYYHSTGYENYPVITHLYVMNSDGSGKRRLTDFVGEDWSPNWSPDGKKIVLISSYLRDIFIVDSDGSHPRRLTDGKLKNEFPVWSPDGKKIAYYSGVYGSWNLFVMNADGSEKTWLAVIKNNGSDMPLAPPVWVP